MDKPDVFRLRPLVCAACGGRTFLSQWIFTERDAYSWQTLAQLKANENYYLISKLLVKVCQGIR